MHCLLQGQATDIAIQVEAELSEFSRENKAKDLDISHNKLRLVATTNEMMQERELPEPQDSELSKQVSITDQARIERSHQGTLYKKHLQEVKLSIAIANKNRVM